MKNLNLKQIIDTTAVILADLLTFKLTKWSAAKAKAAKMHEDYAKGTELADDQELLGAEGEIVKPPVTMTPIRNLLDKLMGWVALGMLAWIIAKIAVAIGGAVLAIAALLVVVGGLTWFFNRTAGKPRRKAEEDTAAAPATA